MGRRFGHRTATAPSVFDVDATPVRFAALVGGGGEDDDQSVHDDRPRATFTARTEQLGVRAGDTVRLSIDPARLHLFAAGDGRRLELERDAVDGAAQPHEIR